MGAWYTFQCESCGYTAEVSGQEDAGFFAQTKTILCETCQELADVTTTVWGPLTSDGQTEFTPVVCPNLSEHPVRDWEYPDVCPKCKGEMSMGESLALWD